MVTPQAYPRHVPAGTGVCGNRAYRKFCAAVLRVILGHRGLAVFWRGHRDAQLQVERVPGAGVPKRIGRERRQAELLPRLEDSGNWRRDRDGGGGQVLRAGRHLHLQRLPKGLPAAATIRHRPIGEKAGQAERQRGRAENCSGGGGQWAR